MMTGDKLRARLRQLDSGQAVPTEIEAGTRYITFSRPALTGHPGFCSVHARDDSLLLLHLKQQTPGGAWYVTLDGALTGQDQGRVSEYLAGRRLSGSLPAVQDALRIACYHMSYELWLIVINSMPFCPDYGRPARIRKIDTEAYRAYRRELEQDGEQT